MSGWSGWTVRDERRKGLVVGEDSRTITISSETYSAAQRVADLDHVSIDILIDSLLKRHIEYINQMKNFSDMPRFSLDDYEMQRDPDETDEEYRTRLELF